MARHSGEAERDETDDRDTVIASAPSDRELAEDAPSDAEVRTPPKLRFKDLLPVYRRALREFTKDQVADIAAGLTYFAVLALFPALLAIVSLLSLVNQDSNVTGQLLALFSSVAPEDTVETLKGPIEDLTATPAAGLGFVVGLVGAIWSAAGFVRAFSRGMNRIYGVLEGRPFLKFQPVILLITVVALVTLTLMALILVLSGDIAEAVGSLIGLGETTLLVWNIAKWPVLALLAMLIIAMLYYFTPNVKQHKFRWLTVGSATALLVWAAATFGFFFYVSNFGSYDATYGTLGGVIVFLLWLYLSNMALLYGGEVDSEIERVRELRAGIKAEYAVQLPLRSTVMIDAAIEAEAKAVLEAKQLRQEG
ncbi:YihY/virulence factor BrkB family protein [Mycetocola manganoxydans]|uniref:YihY/virulence factor BrkB family protein n=1 Tax=Mycetocola manganoxydans TaxID=699879 RepID=A0A3L6ZJ39_9MICO|nr:YihY/virulence factor BrkB family protein [Mycetocola manganoxydans]RLP67857.1 YihY/virulence factor BrkB family protein [Mycetocola manganoxydans]GHD51411.1 ribonuclease [Mycetocola manganoxydans]